MIYTSLLKRALDLVFIMVTESEVDSGAVTTPTILVDKTDSAIVL